ncbi:hypothetical protein ACM40_08045 [Chryseobacterium sp. BLS98]|jgi:hypothetical protein|uniref:hypothetical protein n=1 Tax=Chryseobacterium sp. BLS98 TaxID=885586 RepID=UPI00065AE8E2|nr:hypothetical protein [Chryseobacterium sp. BLS98]KMQ62247.1 hypothetical protein ACM40_08045 [Chryseobacterium sp. BLS98]
MKNISTLLILGSFFCFGLLSSQVGINTNTPKTTLEISAKDKDNPLSNEGVIVPRVTSLNVTNAKDHGLLVFLDFEDPLTAVIERGFYWWNNTSSTWIPFFSMNKMTKDKTITYVSCKSTFDEGPLTSTSTNTRTLGFDINTLIANDTGNFSVNGAGELVVKKAGTYHVQGVISLHSVTNGVNAARDAYEGMVLVNGTEPVPNLRTAYGFPSGATVFDSNTAISGFVTLNVNDRIRFSINRYYRDAGFTDPATITPNSTLSNLTLRYMGSF